MNSEQCAGSSLGQFEKQINAPIFRDSNVGFQGPQDQRTPFFEEQQDNHWEHNQPQQLITGGPSLALGNEPWAREFQTGQFHHNSLAETFPPAMEAVFVNRNDWVDSFNRAQHPIDIDRATAASFQHAFKQAQESGQWTEEFAGSGDLWAQEFAKVRVSEDMQLLDADTTADALSQTAARLLDAVGSTSNEKFKNSQFFSLMRQFKDKEAAIEGEKVVQQIAPVEKSPLEWANEFAGTKIKPAAWEEQFNSMQLNNLAGGAQSERWVKEFTENANLHTNPLIDSNQSWSQEFGQTNNGAWSEEFRQRSFEASDSMQGTTMPPQSDWAEKFKEKMSLLPQDEDKQWSEMNKSWDSGGDGYQATNDLRLSDYEFTPNNPYLSMPLNALSQPISTRNLTESLLQLEASVQQDSRNLESWLSLGKLQQENENDAAAIAALRKALEIDASNLDALLHLAVSYTNENYSSEAYDSLQSWIEMHPKYHEFAPKTGLMAVSQRHQVITQAFMRAAMSRPGEDLDDQVQSCLGVLFNISTEYSKAVDCFESAIARRPDDYQLWNKLGATLANSNDASKAMEAYFTALQINPNYIRARYNLAIASIQMGQYREAAEHLLGALAIQQSEAEQIHAKAGNAVGLDSLHEQQSGTVWSTLRLLLDTYVKRPDLVQACDNKHLAGFRSEFDF